MITVRSGSAMLKLCFIHPFYSCSGAVRWPAPYSSLTNLTPQPLFPLSPFLLLLFLLFSLHLFIKLMRPKLGPSSQGGWQKQAGKASSSLFVHTGALVHVFGCLSLSWNKHFTHTCCDTSSEVCDMKKCTCLYMTRSFSQAPMLCNSTQIYLFLF